LERGHVVGVGVPAQQLHAKVLVRSMKLSRSSSRAPSSPRKSADVLGADDFYVGCVGASGPCRTTILRLVAVDARNDGIESRSASDVGATSA
jgi:hypothetical protein